MRWIPTLDTKAGMVLGESVVDSTGRTLAKRGESVSSELIALFQNAGVKKILALDSEMGTDLPIGAEAVRQRQINEITAVIRKKLEIRFHRFRERAVMQTLLNLAEKQLIQDRISRLSNPPLMSRKDSGPASHEF